jgi:hypothetical protein
VSDPANRPIRNLTDAEMAAAQAAATARSAAMNPQFTAPGPSSLASKLPPIARAAINDGPLTIDGVKIRRPLIQAADVPKLKGPLPPRKIWYPGMRAHAATRQPGDVQQITLEQIGEHLYELARAAGGVARIAFKGIAKRFGICPETARLAVNWWTEGSDFFDGKNVQGWHWIDVKDSATGVVQKRLLLINEENAYIPRLPDELDKAPADEPPVLRKLRRFKAQIQRWAKRSGLFARPLGLNTSPVAARRLYPEGVPAPT